MLHDKRVGLAWAFRSHSEIIGIRDLRGAGGIWETSIPCFISFATNRRFPDVDEKGSLYDCTYIRYNVFFFGGFWRS